MLRPEQIENLYLQNCKMLHEMRLNRENGEDSDTVTISANGLFNTISVDFEGLDEDRQLFCFEFYIERKKYFKWFKSRPVDVLQAEYHINRNFSIGYGEMSVNSFLSMLGISLVDDGDIYGWVASEGYCWIDFCHERKITEKGVVYYKITPQFEPEIMY